MKIENCKLKIILLIIALFVIITIPNKTSAGLIIKLPSNLGLSSGLVGHWTFDGDQIYGTKAYDSSGQGNTGTITGATKTLGKIGQALHFDGSSNYVAADYADYAFDENSDFTISVWIKPETVSSNYHGIVGQSYGNYRLFRVSDNLTFEIDSKTTFGVADILKPNTWYHVVAQYKNTKDVLIYVNGSLELNTHEETLDWTGASTLRIGRPFDNAYYFDGVIDDVRIYNRALSATEVQRLYNIGAGTKISKTSTDSLTDGLVGHWTFDGDQVYGTKAYDSSGQGNTGTITGATKTLGKLGQALEFNGSSSYVSTPYTPSNFTISVWVKPNNLLDSQRIWSSVSGSDRSELILYDNRYDLYGGTNAGYDIWPVTAPAEISVWANIVCVVVQGQKAELYFNGKQVGSDYEINSISLNNLTFGRILSGGGYFDGVIDDARIYNRTLSTDEIRRLYNMGAATKVGKTPTDTLTNGLVGHWTFDGTDIYGTNALDKSGNGNTGTITGATKTLGKIGQALSFDGVNDEIVIAATDTYNLTEDLTVAAWVKPNSTDESQTILARSDGGYGLFSPERGYVLYARTITGERYWHYNISGADSQSFGETNFDTNAPPDDSWHYIVGTTEGNLHKLYVDGVEVKSFEIDVGDRSVSADLVIGDDNNSGGDALTGAIDDVRIYNRALSAEEIQRLYNLGR